MTLMRSAKTIKENNRIPAFLQPFNRADNFKRIVKSIVWLKKAPAFFLHRAYKLAPRSKKSWQIGICHTFASIVHYTLYDEKWRGNHIFMCFINFSMSIYLLAKLTTFTQRDSLDKRVCDVLF